MTRKWSARLHLQSLTVPTRLHLFASYDRYAGDEDNMFLSEYLEFVHSLLLTINHEDTVPKVCIKFFYHLTHSSPLCINRYELVCALALLCRDIHVGDNADRVWNVLQCVSSLTEGIHSFTVFVRAVITMITIMTPQLLLSFNQDAESLVGSLSASMIASYTSFDASFASNHIIKYEPFLLWASSSFCIDEAMRAGCSLLNARVGRLQTLLGVRWASFHDICAALKTIDEGDGSFLCTAFVDVRAVVRDNP